MALVTLPINQRCFFLSRLHNSDEAQRNGTEQRRLYLYKCRFEELENATILFRDHQSSAAHKTALQLVVDIPVLYPDVGEMISTGMLKKRGTAGNVY